MVCHTRAANYVLGLSTPQMNRAYRYGDVEENQLVVLERLGVFRDPLPRRPAEMAALADPLDASASVDARARSYLHANCSYCHVSAGGGNARLELETTTPLEKMNLVGERRCTTSSASKKRYCSRGAPGAIAAANPHQTYRSWPHAAIEHERGRYDGCRDDRRVD